MHNCFFLRETNLVIIISTIGHNNMWNGDDGIGYVYMHENGRIPKKMKGKNGFRFIIVSPSGTVLVVFYA